MDSELTGNRILDEMLFKGLMRGEITGLKAKVDFPVKGDLRINVNSQTPIRIRDFCMVGEWDDYQQVAICEDLATGRVYKLKHRDIGRKLNPLEALALAGDA